MFYEWGWPEDTFLSRRNGTDEESLKMKRHFMVLRKFEVAEMTGGTPPWGEELITAAVRLGSREGLKAWRARLLQTAEGLEVLQICDVFVAGDIPPP